MGRDLNRNTVWDKFYTLTCSMVFLNCTELGFQIGVYALGSVALQRIWQCISSQNPFYSIQSKAFCALDYGSFPNNICNKQHVNRNWSSCLESWNVYAVLQIWRMGISEKNCRLYPNYQLPKVIQYHRIGNSHIKRCNRWGTVYCSCSAWLHSIFQHRKGDTSRPVAIHLYFLMT